MTRKLVMAHNIFLLLFVRARKFFMQFHYNIFLKKNKVFFIHVKNNSCKKYSYTERIESEHINCPFASDESFFHHEILHHDS